MAGWPLAKGAESSDFPPSPSPLGHLAPEETLRAPPVRRTAAIQGDPGTADWPAPTIRRTPNRILRPLSDESGSQAGGHLPGF